jgi:hypothetical protein
MHEEIQHHAIVVVVVVVVTSVPVHKICTAI